MAVFEKKVISKLKYHQATYTIIEKTKNRPGRPSKDKVQDYAIIGYQIQMNVRVDESRIEESIRKECTFIL